MASRRAIEPNTRQGIYPFKDVKLSRADVEWLLATHHGGRGPLFFDAPPEGPHMRGLDLRGADLRFADLYRLPLRTLLANGISGKISAQFSLILCLFTSSNGYLLTLRPSRKRRTFSKPVERYPSYRSYHSPTESTNSYTLPDIHSYGGMAQFYGFTGSWIGYNLSPRFFSEISSGTKMHNQLYLGFNTSEEQNVYLDIICFKQSETTLTQKESPQRDKLELPHK